MNSSVRAAIDEKIMWLESVLRGAIVVSGSHHIASEENYKDLRYELSQLKEFLEEEDNANI